MVLQNILRGLGRHSRKSLAVFLTVLVLSAALMLFGGSTANMRRALEKMEREAVIPVVITNIAGVRNNGMLIREKYLDPLLASPLLVPEALQAGAVLSKEATDKDSIVITDWTGLARVTGTLTPEDYGEPAYASGWDGSLFAGSEAVCVVSAGYMEREGLKPGDTLERHLYSSSESRRGHTTMYYADAITLTVAGSCEGAGMPDVLLPYNTLRNAVKEAGRAFVTNTARFRVADAGRLEETKALLEEVKFLETEQSTGTAGNYGDRAVVQDRTYITTAEPILRNIWVMESFYPLITLVIALTGLLVSGFTVRDRRMETAIYLSLGTPRGVIFLTLTGELLLLTLGAALLAAGGVALFTGVSLWGLLPQVGLMLGAYLLGSGAWVLLQTFLSPMALLRQND